MKNKIVISFILILACVLTLGCAKKPIVKERYVAQEDNPLRVKITDNEFTVSGKRLWINGANTPWNDWNEFGTTYDDEWWDDHFAELRAAGINATRVWINCNNDNEVIEIDEDGMVSDVYIDHWVDLDMFFKTAERNQIYIMATLLSFDHFKDPTSRPRAAAQRWRNMMKSKAASASFVEHYTIPFVQRYRDNPWLWSIDIINEPDWIHENPECGKLSWENISYFLALNAAAIHEHSEILVTVGMAFPKYNADGAGYEGNKVSDAYLQRLYPNKNAYLDFWSPHYYDWVGQWYGVPFYLSPYGRRPGGWGMDSSKPALIGECKAKGSEGKTILEDYENAFLNGWQGMMPWTSNGVDANGDLSDFSAATLYMLEHHREIIFP